MKFDSIAIDNFLTIQKADLKLKDRGLVLIQGENRDESSADSNGSGKSSVFDALCWCLYGETARGVSGDDVINNKTGKKCVVSVVIVDGPTEIGITRMRKPNQLTVYVNGVSVTKGTEKETQEAIVRLLGCSLEVFTAAVYAGQDAMPDLPGMTDKQLKELIEEASGTEVLNQAYSLAKEKLLSFRTRQTLLEDKITVCKTAIKSGQDSIDRLLDLEGAFIKSKTDLMTSLKTTVEETTGKIKTLDAEIASYDAIMIKNRITAIDRELKGMEPAKQAAKKAKEALDAAMLAFGRAKDKHQRLEDDAAYREKAVANVSARVGTPCSECGKEYHTHDLASATALAVAAAAEAKALATKAAEEFQEQRDKTATLKAEYVRLEGLVPDASALMDELIKLNGQKATLEKLELTKKWTVDGLKKTLESKKEELAKPSPFMPEIELHQKLVETEKAKLELLEVDLTANKKQVELAEFAVKVFGPAGVRAHILDTVTPYLNDRTAEYLGALSDGTITATWSTIGTTAKGELREKFNIEVQHSNGSSTFKGLSGGEKRKVRLACALALQDLVATRATKPIDLFVADEVDHALDESGLERLMGVFEKKARERGSVFVISHNPLADWIDNVVTVVKESGVSTVVDGVAK